MTRAEFIKQYLTEAEAAALDATPVSMWNLLGEDYEPDYQRKLLERATEMGMDMGDPPEKHEASGLIRCSFAWDQNPEGYDFWRGVCDRLNKEPIQ